MYLTQKKMSDNLRKLLDNITPNFEENLKRAFINEGVRTQMKIGYLPHQLDDVFVTIDNTIIELRNLKLVKTPDFRINLMDVDLSMLTINLGLSLGQLKIEGEYEVTNKTLQKILPISHVGKIAVVLENTNCDGKAGLHIKEDSFVVENYDLKYHLSEIILRVSYFKEDGLEVDNEMIESDLEKTLVNMFWVQLTDILTNILHRQLGAVIVEFSVNELLLDDPDEMKAYSRQLYLRANRLLDSILCTAKTFLVEKDYLTIDVPSLSVVFKSRPPGTQQGSLETVQGEISDLSTLTRLTQANLYEDKNCLVVYGQVRLRDFKFIYPYYKAMYSDSVSEGSLKSSIYRSKVFLKITIQKDQNKCNPQIDLVQVRTVNDIDIDISGLGSLSWLRDRLRSWIIGNLRNKALPHLEEKIKEAINHAISITDCKSLII
ncbi:uncharacterized protein [Onthophagus taurus]|uniref:uncharacterized protein isoform X2 n=1 Tax=Onthophagus taurus TaxID=166361 RepID=UPI000C20848F|nr:uncharacterized protein LOC111426271 isoform X2 [Onthophagus taurus]